MKLNFEIFFNLHIAYASSDEINYIYKFLGQVLFVLYCSQDYGILWTLLTNFTAARDTVFIIFFYLIFHYKFKQRQKNTM